RKIWAAMPSLAASAALGGPRAGATVLAVTAAPGGGIFPAVAVQRYGNGRSMIFAGEASWRWKMMRASTDRSYEFFWRQAARWLSSASPDPVAIGVPEAPEPGDAISIDVDARDASFAPVPDATIDATLTAPGGSPQPLKLRHTDPAGGRFTAALRPEQQGLYRVHAEARRGSALLGSADRWMYVGGADREFADPRLNEALLRRVGRRSVRAQVRHVARHLRRDAAAQVHVSARSPARSRRGRERGRPEGDARQRRPRARRSAQAPCQGRSAARAADRPRLIARRSRK